MKRLTSDDTKSIFYSLNLFFAKDNEVWIRGGGPEPDYQDCTLVNWIGRVADKHNLEILARNAEDLGDEMYDCLQYGIDTIEGVVALLHAAAVQATTMRSRLKEIEDILGDDYDLDRLKELVEADRKGRCVVLSDGSYTDKDGEEALKNAMFILSLTNDGINRYIADAIAEKLVREESESALEKMKEDDE